MATKKSDGATGGKGSNPPKETAEKTGRVGQVGQVGTAPIAPKAVESETAVVKDSSNMEIPKELQREAKSGSPTALYHIGLLYKESNTPNYDKAYEYFQQAADAGLAEAVNELGLCFYEANGVTGDASRAAQLFERAADMGCPRAMANIAECYWDGDGIKRDEEKACQWAELAEENGEKVKFSSRKESTQNDGNGGSGSDSDSD